MEGFELLNYPDLIQVLLKAMPNDQLFKHVVEVSLQISINFEVLGFMRRTSIL